jgi:hypothetical protein
VRQPQDRQPPADRRGFDARGRVPPERISEYFDFERWPEKAERKVTRLELLALLTQLEKGREQTRFLSRLWRFLRRPVNSGPVPATEPTAAEVERGEGTPT